MIPGTKMKLTFADTLAASPLPFVLVASKCDIQTPDGPVESALGHYEIQRTSPVSPRSQKVCIAMVLRSVVGHKYGGRFSLFYSVYYCFLFPLRIWIFFFFFIFFSPSTVVKFLLLSFLFPAVSPCLSPIHPRGTHCKPAGIQPSLSRKGTHQYRDRTRVPGLEGSGPH